MTSGITKPSRQKHKTRNWPLSETENYMEKCTTFKHLYPNAVQPYTFFFFLFYWKSTEGFCGQKISLNFNWIGGAWMNFDFWVNYTFKEWFEKWAKLAHICSQKLKIEIVTADSSPHLLRITHGYAVNHEVKESHLALRYKHSHHWFHIIFQFGTVNTGKPGKIAWNDIPWGWHFIYGLTPWRESQLAWCDLCPLSLLAWQSKCLGNRE